MDDNPTLTAPNEGLTDQLDYILSAPIPGVIPWALILWQNSDLVPSQTTVFAELQEATFQGYSRVTLQRSTWTASVIESNMAVSTYGTTPQQWTPKGTPQQIYGWAVITSVSPVIRYIQPFPSPVTAGPGLPIGVLPRVTLTTLPESSLMVSRRAARKRGVKVKGR